MDLTPETVGEYLAERLMRAVAESGFVAPEDADLAVTIMREELKSFVCGGKNCRYAEQRYRLITGEDKLAWGEFVTSVILRVIREREALLKPGVIAVSDLSDIKSDYHDPGGMERGEE